MPDFHVEGDPGAITAKVATMRETATTFTSVAEGLESITTDGWTGRAADRFREKFDTEPGRWRDAGDGFRRAADALAAYASELADAQSRAEWAEREHARGDQVTRDARAAYDADVAAGRREQSQAQAAGQVFHLTILPFDDPGEDIRRGALDELASARSDLQQAAARCAGEVRAGCAAAPEKRNWFESGAAFVGGVIMGAGEAVWELGELVYDISFAPYVDLMRVATGDLTVEELAMKNQLKLEQAQALFEAATTDPIGFGRNVGKALLDWDNWADDPANALGRLIPDAVATIASGGAGASVRALRGLEGLHDISLLARPMHGLRSLGGMDLGDLSGLSRLDDAALASRIDALSPADQARLLTRGEEMRPGTMSEVFGSRRGDSPVADLGVFHPTYDGGAPTAVGGAARVDGPLANLHGHGDAGSGLYWTDPHELLTSRTETAAMDRMALRPEWYTERTPDGDLSFRPRDEISVREFSRGEDMRMESGPLAPQTREDAVNGWDAGQGAAPDTWRGVDVTDWDQPGGATQYVNGLDDGPWNLDPMPTWTGPAPWVEAVPDGVQSAFAGSAAGGAATSLGAGAVAAETSG